MREKEREGGILCVRKCDRDRRRRRKEEAKKE